MSFSVMFIVSLDLIVCTSNNLIVISEYSIFNQQNEINVLKILVWVIGDRKKIMVNGGRACVEGPVAATHAHGKLLPSALCHDPPWPCLIRMETTGTTL